MDKAPDTTDSFRCSTKPLGNHRPFSLPYIPGLDLRLAARDCEEAPQQRHAKGRAGAGNRGALSVVNVKTIIKPAHSLLLVITVCRQSYTVSVVRMRLSGKILCSASSKQLLQQLLSFSNACTLRISTCSPLSSHKVSETPRDRAGPGYTCHPYRT